MKILRMLALLFQFILWFTNIFSQDLFIDNYPKNYFRDPLGIPIQLSANFGELRPNHFHMGFDIRTNQRENLPVYAAAEGYISRIKIERFGFGRAIYITHPNGYTTLYAHLNDFYKELNDYVKQAQYRDEQWEQDLVIPAGAFPVTKGQFIAFSGNTGGSAGPHLHFEIRDTKTENNLNPWLFNFSLGDKFAPSIFGLYYYDRTYSTYKTTPQKISLKATKGGFTTLPEVTVVNSPLISFGIKAEDKNNTSASLFGIFQADVLLDNNLESSFQLNNFSYPESRYINASIDYKTNANGGALIQHLSRLPGNKISFFSGSSNGMLDVSDGEIHHVVINVKDAEGNISSINFKVKYIKPLQKKEPAFSNTITIIPNQENEVKQDDIELRFSRNAVYDTLPLVLKATNPTDRVTVSKVFTIHNSTAPLHDSMIVRIKRNVDIPEEFKNKVVMQLLTKKDKEAEKSSWNGDWMEAKFREFGVVKLIIDTIAPTLVPVGFKSGSNLKMVSSISFIAKDNAGELKSFRAELDGHWLMFSRKTDSFIYKFDQHCLAGLHQLKVAVVDIAANTTEKTFSFTR